MASPGRLSLLPTEILEDIFKDKGLVRKELKALRLMNKKICAIANDVLFAVITIYGNKTSRVQASHIVSSYGKRVRHLHYQDPTELYQPQYGYGDFRPASAINDHLSIFLNQCPNVSRLSILGDLPYQSPIEEFCKNIIHKPECIEVNGYSLSINWLVNFRVLLYVFG